MDITNKAVRVSRRMEEIEYQLACNDLMVRDADDLRCEYAELEDLNHVLNEYFQMRTKNELLKTENAELRDDNEQLKSAYDEWKSQWHELNEAIPKIKADAIRDAVNNTNTHRLCGEIRLYHQQKSLIEYADKLERGER